MYLYWLHKNFIFYINFIFIRITFKQFEKRLRKGKISKQS